MTVVLGLLAAIVYGVGDFAGGVGARRISAVTLLVYSYPVGAILTLALLPAFPGHLDGRVVLFGFLGGTAGLVGVVLLYSLMTVAPINVVSPVTAVLATIVPVLVGVITGERPNAAAWFGIVVGVAAIVLVTRTSQDNPHGRVTRRVLGLSVISGVMFGLYFVFLAKAGDDSGLWPLVVSRAADTVLILPIAAARRGLVAVPARVLPIAVLAGLCDAGANLLFLLATREGLLSLASVLTSLYPATTVLLAVGLLRERLTVIQVVGLSLAAGAVVLITV